MRRQAMFLLILAVAAGGLAAFLAARVLREPDAVASNDGGISVQSVAVAARDMNAGTLLQEDDVRMVEWPSREIPAGYSMTAADVIGRGLLTPVSANEPLLSVKLASLESGGGMPIMIPAGKRAMSVRVDDVVGVAGFVLPGTRVDVLVTMERTGSSQNEAATRLVLQNIEVVSAGQSLERDPDGNPQEVAVVTLLVGPVEAEQLALSHSSGRLQLALRNPLDMDSVQTPGITASQVIALRPPPQPVVRAAAPRPASTPVQPQGLTLEVYRGPERTTSDVEQTLEAGPGGGS